MPTFRVFIKWSETYSCIVDAEDKAEAMRIVNDAEDLAGLAAERLYDGDFQAEEAEETGN